MQGVMPRNADFQQNLCAAISGFSLHAAVRCKADDRQAREPLCRYITHPALAKEHVHANATGQVVPQESEPRRPPRAMRAVCTIARCG